MSIYKYLEEIMKGFFCLIFLFLFSNQAFCVEDNHIYTTKSLLNLLRTNGHQNNIVVKNGELGLMLPNFVDSEVSVRFFSIKELLQKLHTMESEMAATICSENSAESVTVSLGIISTKWEREKLCSKKGSFPIHSDANTQIDH